MEAEDRSTTVIRTPDRRLRVFVSSTLAELAEERTAVARAIAALRLTPVLFELGAQSHPPRELYRAYLAQSDIFIGLYWQRYGWIGPEMDISGLEDEFRLSASMPRLLYVKTPAPHREARLTAMIDELETKGTVSYRSFRTPRELGRLVRTDLAVLLSERFAAGDNRPLRSSSPPNGSRRLPRWLPVGSTSLIGRAQDLGAISTLLETDGVRLVTLTGPIASGRRGWRSRWAQSLRIATHKARFSCRSLRLLSPSSCFHARDFPAANAGSPNPAVRRPMRLRETSWVRHAPPNASRGMKGTPICRLRSTRITTRRTATRPDDEGRDWSRHETCSGNEPR